MKYQVIDQRIILISGSDIDMANIKEQLEILNFCQVGENTWKFESNSTEIFDWVWTRMMVIIKPRPIFAHEEELMRISLELKAQSERAQIEELFSKPIEPVMVYRTKDETRELVKKFRNRKVS